MAVNARTATLSDVKNFKLRPEDIEEARALGYDGLDALRLSFEFSTECLVGELDGAVFCILGISPVSDGANLWMLFTCDIKTLPVDFFRKSQEHVRRMLDAYGTLHSKTLPENTFIIRWLKWLGFTMEDTRPYLTFHLRRGD